MATSITLPQSFNSTSWMKDAKDPKQSAAKPFVDKVKANLDAAQKGHDGLKAVMADASKLKNVAEIQQRIVEVTKEQDQFKSVKAAVDGAAKGAGDYLKAAGKDISANAKKQADAIQKDATSYLSSTNKLFDDVFKTLTDMRDKAAKPVAAKTPSGGGAAAKADEQLLMKLSKKAVAFAMKPKLGVKPMQFAIIGKKGTPIKLLMGTKTEVAKLIGKFWKPDPATKKKPVLAKDPMSKVLFEKGALIFESAKISNGYLGSMKKALVVQIKKSPKLKWRKPGMPDEEAPGGGDELKADDVHVEEEKVDAAAMAKASAGFSRKLAELKKDPRFDPKAKGEIGETIQEMLGAFQKKDYIEALDLAEAVEALLDSTPEESDDEDTPVAAKSASDRPAAKSAATAPAPAAKSATAAATPQPTAKTAAGASGSAAGKGDKELAALADTWVKTRDAAIKEVEGLKAEIQKLYPKGDPSVQAAMKQLDGSVSKLKVGLDAALKGAAGKAEAQRATLIAAAKSKVADLINHIDSDSVMVNLDDNEVKPISAGAKLRAGLKTLQDALN